MPLVQLSPSHERRTDLEAEFARARTSCLASKAELRMVLQAEDPDLARVEVLAERVALCAARLAGFARLLSREPPARG